MVYEHLRGALLQFKKKKKKNTINSVNKENAKHVLIVWNAKQESNNTILITPCYVRCTKLFCFAYNIFNVGLEIDSLL